MGADPINISSAPVPIKGYVIPLRSELAEIDHDIKCGLDWYLDLHEEMRLVFVWIWVRWWVRAEKYRPFAGKLIRIDQWVWSYLLSSQIVISCPFQSRWLLKGGGWDKVSHTLRGEVSLPRFVGEGTQTQGHWAPLGSPWNVIEAVSLRQTQTDQTSCHGPLQLFQH